MLPDIHWFISLTTTLSSSPSGSHWKTRSAWNARRWRPSCTFVSTFLVILSSYIITTEMSRCPSWGLSSSSSSFHRVTQERRGLLAPKETRLVSNITPPHPLHLTNTSHQLYVTLSRKNMQVVVVHLKISSNIFTWWYLWCFWTRPSFV